MACKPRSPGWYFDPEVLRDEYKAHGTWSEVARVHGGHPTTYSRRWVQLGLPPLRGGPKLAAPGDVELELDTRTLGDIAAELRSRGLNPDEWVVVRVVVNTWGPETDQNKQLKITLRPRLDVLLKPADTGAEYLRPTVRLVDSDKPRLVVFVGDEQAPYHDPVLHELFRKWLEHNKPGEAVHLGDIMDLPTLSRHRRNPAWDAGPQECVQAAYDILAGYRSSSPGTSWRALPGNHDERLRDYQLSRAPELFGLRPADMDDRELAALHSLPALLHFAELGVEWLGDDGDYEHAQVDVSPELVARHGWVISANGAEKTVRRLGLNVVVGHTHRQRVHYITEERRRETLVTVCVEAGCMCQIEGGLGYTVNPDWQNGFYAATVWPDGTFSGEHGRYENGVLLWRDQRYEP